MVKVIIQKARDGAPLAVQNILSFVICGLVERMWRRQQPILLNVEDVFRAIEAVANRAAFDAPFSYYDLRIDRLDCGSTERPSVRLEREQVPLWEEFIASLRNEGVTDDNEWWSRVHPPLETFETDGKTFVRQMRAILSGGQFAATLDWLLKAVFDLTFLKNPEEARYYGSLAKHAHGIGATIATPNYDNAVEMGCRQRNLIADVAVGRWWNEGEFGFSEPTGLRLLKLHGSVEWQWNRLANGSWESAGAWDGHGSFPPNAILAGEAQPAIIFGQRNKLTAHGPFLDLYQEFKRVLSASRDLRVVGYAFADEHINEAIVRWLAGHKYRRLRICDIQEESAIEAMLPPNIRYFGSEQVRWQSVDSKEYLSSVFSTRDWSG